MDGCTNDYNVLLSRQQATSEDVETDPLAVFHGAFQNVMPVMGTRGVRKGGRLYQVCTLDVT